MRIDNPTFNPGGLNTAATASNLAGNTPAYAYGTRLSAQAISNTTLTQVTNWSTTVNETGGQWSGTTGTFTANRDGIYLVTGNVSWPSITPSNDKVYRLFITKNGSANQIAISQHRSEATSIQQNVSTGTCTAVVPLTTGDTFAFFVYHDHGSTISLDGPINTFSLVEIGNKIQR
jgi:hypothetical protein